MEKREMIRYLFIASFLLVNSLLFTGCKDDYPFDNEEPPRSVLASSIYDFLMETDKGSFTYFTRIADAVPTQSGVYSDVLKKTGSKTAFVATDEAFNAFFANNSWGVRKFEDLSEAQRRMILFFSMIDDAYSLDMLSSMPGSGGSPAIPGEVMRKTSSLGLFDSIPFEKNNQVNALGEKMPDLPDNSYWERFDEKGLYVLKDNSIPTLVYFMQSFMDSKGITDKDFKDITGKDRVKGDAHIFDIKIVDQDMFCKNGYVNILESVLTPRDNMAEYIRKNENTTLFNSFLERFCAPYYDEASSYAYRDLNSDFNDSIFVKVFFNPNQSVDPRGKSVLTLPFDPGKNNYAATGQGLEANIAAMFVPTDDALNHYFENAGSFLKDQYGTWENVPDNVILDLVAHQMKPSFLLALPSKFANLEDKMGTKMGASPEDLVVGETNICSNGVVYVVDKVYAPTEYTAVSAPVSFNPGTRIFNWAVKNLEFDLYLLSMEKEPDESGNLVISNPFTFFVPTDEVLKGTFNEEGKMIDGYIDPVMKSSTGIINYWSFFFNEQTSKVNAVVYDANGDSIRLVTTASQIDNRLNDLMDNHIIVGRLSKDKEFYQAKGRAAIEVKVKNWDEVETDKTALEIRGGANIEEGKTATNLASHFQTNGETFFTSEIIQPSLKSVYDILIDTENYPEFEEFFNLCAGAQVYKDTQETEYAGLVFEGGIVSFFSTYHYTIYVPTNQAIKDAYSAGIVKSWEEIDEIEDLDERAQEAQKTYEFIRYHFQDNSVFVTNKVSQFFETATMNPVDRKFRKLRFIEFAPDRIGLYSEKNDQFNAISPSYEDRSARVVTSNPLYYNIMARDYTLTGSGVNATIATSSFAVIHQIDKVLDFNN